MCPIVPTFTCGFDRSNFSFAISSPTQTCRESTECLLRRLSRYAYTFKNFARISGSTRSTRLRYCSRTWPRSESPSAAYFSASPRRESRGPGLPQTAARAAWRLRRCGGKRPRARAQRLRRARMHFGEGLLVLNGELPARTSSQDSFRGSCPVSLCVPTARLKPCPVKTAAGAKARTLLRRLRHDQGRALIQNRAFCNCPAVPRQSCRRG